MMSANDGSAWYIPTKERTCSHSSVVRFKFTRLFGTDES